MSDFGTIITFEWSLQAPPDESEFNNIEKLLLSVISNKTYKDCEGALLHPKTINLDTDNKSNTISYVLTEYWSEGVDQGLYCKETEKDILSSDIATLEELSKEITSITKNKWKLNFFSTTW